MQSLLKGLILVLCVSWVAAQSCNIQANTDYGKSGDLTTLYNVASVQACCEACKGFEECNYFTYVKDSTLDTYKQCVVKTNSSASQQSTSNSKDSGYINRVYNRPVACSQEVGYNYYTVENLGNFQAANSDACCKGCQARPGCQYWTLTGNTCYMKAALGNRTQTANLVSGTVIPASIANTPKRTGTKRGLALFDTVSCSDIRLLGNITWIYNWARDPGVLEECYLELGIQFVPMVWGRDFAATAPLYVYSKATHILGFNEPNFSDQANMTPQEAANLWHYVEEAAAKNNMLIGSPSASYGGQNGNPIDWLDSFFALCTNCKVDFIATHQYECNADSMHGAIGNFKKYNKPIWVTEFACYGDSDPQETAFMQSILNKFDGDSAIQRYSWFGTRTKQKFNNIFTNDANGLSPAGLLYAGGLAPSSSSTSSASASATSTTASGAATTSTKVATSTTTSAKTTTTTTATTKAAASTTTSSTASQTSSSTSSTPPPASSTSSAPNADSSSTGPRPGTSTTGGGGVDSGSGASTVFVSWALVSLGLFMYLI